MPVNTPTEEYDEWKERWKRCRDAVAGSDAVKGEETLYLPMIGNPYDPLSIEKYKGYLERALFHGYTARAVQGLEGAIGRKDPIIEFPEDKIEMLDHITVDGESLKDFANQVVHEVISVGRFGILVDMPEGSSDIAYFAGYETENIDHIGYTKVDGEERLSMVVLREYYDQQDGRDPFKVIKMIRYRVLTLDEVSRYKVEVYAQVGKSEDDKFLLDKDLTVMPTFRGSRLNYIPFICVNPNAKIRGIQKPPILDVVDANMSHYRSSADLENGRHWNGCPTMWGSGIIKDDAGDIVVGSPKAHLFSNENAKLMLLELKEGLEPLENAMKEKQELIVVLGARLLEEEKTAVETAESRRQRQAGENSVLATISINISSFMTKGLIWLAEWSGISGDVSISLNTDFVVDQLVAGSMKELRELLMVGDISFETFFYNMKRMELYPEGWSIEDELNAIDEEGGGLSRGKTEPAPELLEEDED